MNFFPPSPIPQEWRDECSSAADWQQVRLGGEEGCDWGGFRSEPADNLHGNLSQDWPQHWWGQRSLCGCHHDVITKVLSLQAFDQLARLILKKVSYFNLYSNCKTSLNLFSKEPCCKHFTILIQDMRPRPIRVWCYNHWVKTWILIYVYSCTASCTWSCNVNSAEEHILQLCSGDRGISRIFVILRLAAPCTHWWLHTSTCPVHAYTLQSGRFSDTRRLPTGTVKGTLSLYPPTQDWSDQP